MSTPGWADNAVKPAYDLMFNWQLRAMRQFDQLADFAPKQVPHRGSSIVCNINEYYAAADVLAAQTPLVDEVDVTSTKLPPTSTVTFTPQEYGAASKTTLKLSNRGLTPVDPVVAEAIAKWCVDSLDGVAQTAVRLGTNVLRPPGRAATNTVAQNATDYGKATLIRQAVTTLSKNQSLRRDGQFYVAVVHPHVLHDLREEPGSGSWRVPKEYGVDQSDIYNGEFGAFEGCRFISTPTVWRPTDADGATGANVYRSYIMGKEALGKATVVAPNVVLGPQTDMLRRVRSIGWYADLAYAVYRNASLIRLETSASILAP